MLPTAEDSKRGKRYSTEMICSQILQVLKQRAVGPQQLIQNNSSASQHLLVPNVGRKT